MKLNIFPFFYNFPCCPKTYNVGLLFVDDTNDDCDGDVYYDDNDHDDDEENDG